jgi:PAS domain S-box-containing protein
MEFVKQALRVLIVDDSNDDATLLLHTLRSGWHEVAYALVDNEVAMRESLDRQDWDVITSDHSMPMFSAPEALALAKELRPNCPFIIVSGEIDLDLAVLLIKNGARDYVRKQDLPRLVATVQRELRLVGLSHERQRLREALESSEIRYRRLFETAKDGILILDASTGQILDVNPFLIEMLGYSKDEFLGKALWEIGAFCDKEASQRAFAVLRSEGYVRYDDLPLETREGAHVSVEFVSNVYMDNKVKVAQCNIRNITERKHAEAENRDLIADLELRLRKCSLK